MLAIVANYDCIQFYGKLMTQTWENGKKTYLDPIFAHLAEIRVDFFFP